MADIAQLSTQDRALYSKLHQLLTEPGLVLGSLVTMRRSCGKEGCHCQKGPRHRHASLYLAVRVGKKRRLLYVPPSWVPRITQWVARSNDLREILQEISESFVRRLVNREQ